MKWPRVRFTVRRIMVLVAAVAIVLASSSAFVRYLKCRGLAEYYARVEEQHRQIAGFHELTAKLHRNMAADHREKARTAEFDSGKKGWREDAEFWDERMAAEEAEQRDEMAKSERAAALRTAFDRAARRPWRALPPEPTDLR